MATEIPNFSGHCNPPPPPPVKYSPIRCDGCGATHDRYKCPYCGNERVIVPAAPKPRKINY